MTHIPTNSLVLYKTKAARVVSSGEKLTIEIQGGESRKVRPKDVTLLHQGPLTSLDALRALSGELEIAWEILAGETTTLTDLAELVFDQVTPSTVWATWEMVGESLYFHGTSDALETRSADEVARIQAEQDARDADQRAWSDFIDRVREGQVLPAETENLSGVEALAYGRTAQSRVLRELGRGTTPENAHALLLKLGHWDARVNPYPHRFDLPLDPPVIPVPTMPEEERRDLTHLAAYAIDDEGNQDPDDAISIDGDYLWVHVADVAALVSPRSTLDMEARGRGANLYLPEITVPMLPPEMTHILGLGLQEISPALSFGFRVAEDGTLSEIDITPSRVKVTRLSYAEAETRLEEAPFKQIRALTGAFGRRRTARGSVALALPEVKIRVSGEQIDIRPLPRLESREMVTDAMLMAGEAAARFAVDHLIPFPFTTQLPPDTQAEPEDMAAMFAFRKHFKRSLTKTTPEPHAGLGMEMYARATSPLRRYVDLVAHQQLRAFLKDETPLSSQEITERVGAAEAVMDSLRRAERFSNKHWTLVYLKQAEHWRGEGVLVELRGKRGTVLIPELGLEAQLQLDDPPPLNSSILLYAKNVDLPELSVRFKREHAPTP